MELRKVILEYSDGTIRFLEGEDALKWSVFNEQVAIQASIRNFNPPWEILKWKEGKIDDYEQKNTQENKE